jgi:hypothetical protein
MALFNYATKEITLKIVYYGPGLSGKTTNLQYLHSVLNPKTRGKLLSLSTEADRTLFFDFLPVELGKLKDFTIRFQLYTVPGQVRYNATRKVVLKGADAVVFVADSQLEMREQNIESFENMRENLSVNNIDPNEIPVVLQYNKRDLRNILSVDELNSDLNTGGYRFIEAVAIEGAGVEESFKLITRLMIEHISKKHKIEIHPVKDEPDVVPALPGGALGPREISTQSFASASAIVRNEENSDIPETDLKKRTAARLEDLPRELTPVTESSGAPGTVGASVIPAERFDRIAKEVEEIKAILLSLKTTVSELAVEMQQLDGIKKETEKTNTLLRDILAVFSTLKTKKTWFKVH